jgi:alpha-mannosidase
MAMMKATTIRFIFGLCWLALTGPVLAVSISQTIPADEIRVQASSVYNTGQTPENLINGAGLDAEDRHDNHQYAATMWHTAEHPAASSPATGLPAFPAWVRFDFSKAKPIDRVLIWNHNQAALTDRGFRKTKIFGTIDGTQWPLLAEVELKRAAGQAEEAQVVPLANAANKSYKAITIAAESNYGGEVYGLSAVQFSKATEVADDAMPFPAKLTADVTNVYRHRPDGKAGREVDLAFKDAKLYGNAEIDVTVDGRPAETVSIAVRPKGVGQFTLLLPSDVGVKQAAQVGLTLHAGKKSLSQAITVPAQRQWTVYLYNHAHVDIGYTNTQKNIEILHKSNILEGIKLAQATKDYPAGSRYRWNPEVTWPLERLWVTMPEQRDHVLQAIRDGQLCVDASYVNLDTSVCSDEELFHVFSFSRQMQTLTGMPMDTFQQMDVPGMSWGLLPVMAHEGVHYIMAWPNSARSGRTHDDIDQRPFWWVGPDGKSKVLFLQPGGYGNSGSMSKGGSTGRPWFGQRDPDKVPAVIKTGSANVNFVGRLAGMEDAKFPYDFLVLSWSLWDNCPLDADIPDAVKAWNEQYAYPHIIIAGGHEIMETIEKKYGDKLPVVKGDFTEYWTDGLGTAARLTALNRNAKERLTQAETLWTMLRPGKPSPRDDFDEAWRCIALGSEHTWCSENPAEPYFLDAIWKVKQSYFREADDRSQALLDDALAPATDKSNGALGPGDGPANGGVAVFNTHSWKHGGLVTLSKVESSHGDRVTDDQGKDMPAQRLSTGELVFMASDVPAFGSSHYRVVAGKCPLESGCTLKDTTLENHDLRVTVDPATGNITQLINLATGRNFVDAKVNGGLNAFRWIPGGRNEPKADTDIAISTVESGPLVVELRVSSKATGCRSVGRSVRLVAGQPWVEVTNVVDKLPLPAKDGIHFGFGFDIPQSTTHVDIPWGVMEMEKDQWPQANRNWIAMQRWLDISSDKEGVTWCSLDTPLFEYGGITANLVTNWGNGGPWISKLTPSSTVYSWAMNNHWITNFPLTQDGPVTFRYRILPHGAYDVAAANHFGMEQAQPLAHVMANSNPALKPLVALDGPPTITVSILKSTAEVKTLIVRLRSVSNKDETVTLSWPAGAPKSLSLCEISETPSHPVSGAVTVPANGLLTLRAELP